MSDWYAILCLFLNFLATETPDTERSKFQVHLSLAEWHHNYLPLGEWHHNYLPLAEWHHNYLPLAEWHHNYLPLAKWHHDYLPLVEWHHDYLPLMEWLHNYLPLAEWHHNSLLIEMGLAGVTSWGQRVTFLVAIEGIQTDWEAEGMEDFVLHRWQQYLEFLWFCADTLWTQVGVSCYRSANKHRPHNIVQTEHRSLSHSDRRCTQTRSQKLRRQTAVTSKNKKIALHWLTVHYWLSHTATLSSNYCLFATSLPTQGTEKWGNLLKI